MIQPESAVISRFPGLTPTRSRAVVHDDLVFTVAVAPDPVTSSMYEQSAKALARIDESLALCGSDKSKILSAIVYITDMKRKGEMNRAWDDGSIRRIHRCGPASASTSNRRISWRSW